MCVSVTPAGDLFNLDNICIAAEVVCYLGLINDSMLMSLTYDIKVYTCMMINLFFGTTHSSVNIHFCIYFMLTVCTTRQPNCRFNLDGYLMMLKT